MADGPLIPVHVRSATLIEEGVILLLGRTASPLPATGVLDVTAPSPPTPLPQGERGLMVADPPHPQPLSHVTPKACHRHDGRGAPGSPLPLRERAARSAGEGGFDALSWPASPSGTEGHHVLVVLRTAGLASIALGDLVLRPVGQGETDDTDASGGPAEVSPGHTLVPGCGLRPDPAPLAAELLAVGLEGEAIAAVIAFLERVLPPAGGGLPARLLAGLSRPAGFVELFGRLEGPAFLLQGWSSCLAAGAVDVYIETDRLIRLPAGVGTYDRPDLHAPACGCVALVRAHAPVDFAAVRRVYVRTDAGWHHLDVFANRIFLGADEAPAHLRSLLGSLRALPGAARLFRRMAAPRFTGVETVSALARPVRAAVDFAVATHQGLFIAGWLLDPEGAVAAVTLRAQAVAPSPAAEGGRPDGAPAVDGRAWRLDGTWARLPRRDVSDGFAADPLFSGRLRPSGHRHGFFAFAAGAVVAEGETLHLDLIYDDWERAFLPVAPLRPRTREEAGALVRRILACVDPDDPAHDTAVAAHIGPAATALLFDAPSADERATVLTFGRRAKSAPRRPVTAVLALPPNGGTDLDVTLARLAIDPDFAGVELVVVAPGASSAAAASAVLKRCAGFYGLDTRLMIADGPEGEDGTIAAFGRHGALAAGLATVTTDLVLFLSAGVFPRTAGWLSRLVATLRAAGAAVVTPTLLFEDDSIRFAGGGGQGSGGEGAFGASVLTGYARHWLENPTTGALARAPMRRLSQSPRRETGWDAGGGPAAEAVPTARLASECCLIARAAFDHVGGFARDHVGGEHLDADLALRLQAAGFACLWLPPVEMIGLDEPEPPDAGTWWMQTARRVDEWHFRGRQRPAVAAEVVVPAAVPPSPPSPPSPSSFVRQTRLQG